MNSVLARRHCVSFPTRYAVLSQSFPVLNSAYTSLEAVRYLAPGVGSNIDVEYPS